MIINYIEFLYSELKALCAHFSICEIKGANLPILVAAEESLGVFVAHCYHWHSFLTFSRNRKIRKLFEKFLFPIIKTTKLFPLLLLFLRSITRTFLFFSDLILKKLPELYNFIWLHVLIFLWLFKNGSMVLKKFVFCTFQNFWLNFINAVTVHDFIFYGWKERQPDEENCVISFQKEQVHDRYWGFHWQVVAEKRLKPWDHTVLEYGSSC